MTSTAEIAKILKESAADREGLYQATAARLGTNPAFVEKDLWVCLILDLLFNYVDFGSASEPLLFKGGTSLSKVFDVIQRFSEDVDIVLSHALLNIAPPDEDGISGKTRDSRLKKLDERCREYVSETLKSRLEAELSELGVDAQVLVNEEEAKNLDIAYDSVFQTESYVTPQVKIEAGARSRTFPSELRSITPYVAAELKKNSGLTIGNVRTISIERTFWDKVLVAHMNESYAASDAENLEKLQGRNHLSRHYYDLHRLAKSGKRPKDGGLFADVLAHQKVYFARGQSWGVNNASLESLRLTPGEQLESILRTDYRRMKAMAFGDIPSFDDILSSVKELETWVRGLSSEQD